MRLIWPSMTKEGTVLRRAGRVVFWAGLTVFALIMAVCIYAGLSEPDDAAFSLGMGLVIGLPWYIGGRAICYILAGE